MSFKTYNQEDYIPSSKDVKNKSEFSLKKIEFSNEVQFIGHLDNEDFSEGISGVGEYIYNPESLCSKFSGAIRKNKKEGSGVLEMKNGSVYYGFWKNDLLEGKVHFFGRKIGIKFIGQYVNGAKNGHGEYYYEDGSMFKGEFVDDKIHGYGKYVYKNGLQKYSGQYTNNIKQGKGTLTFHNGDTYNGNIDNGKMTGHGVYTFFNGDTYEGQFKENLMNGIGK